jgi:hypothetical protein
MAAIEKQVRTSLDEVTEDILRRARKLSLLPEKTPRFPRTC